jgi:hypothetical protein
MNLKAAEGRQHPCGDSLSPLPQASLKTVHERKWTRIVTHRSTSCRSEEAPLFGEQNPERARPRAQQRQKHENRRIVGHHHHTISRSFPVPICVHLRLSAVEMSCKHVTTPRAPAPVL